MWGGDGFKQTLQFTNQCDSLHVLGSAGPKAKRQGCTQVRQELKLLKGPSGLDLKIHLRRSEHVLHLQAISSGGGDLGQHYEVSLSILGFETLVENKSISQSLALAVGIASTFSPCPCTWPFVRNLGNLVSLDSG